MRVNEFFELLIEGLTELLLNITFEEKPVQEPLPLLCVVPDGTFRVRLKNEDLKSTT